MGVKLAGRKVGLVYMIIGCCGEYLNIRGKSEVEKTT
jgi:hypothetical protein